MTNAETDTSVVSRLIRSANVEDERLKNIRFAKEQRLEQPHQRIIEVKLSQRRISAQELGRIVIGGNPDFVGNFSDNCPTGIFEMYIEEQKENGEFSGKIEDCFGTSIFKGIISPERVHFAKQYIPEESSVYASSSVLEYVGFFKSDTGKCRGTYTFVDNRRVCGRFSMNKSCFENASTTDY